MGNSTPASHDPKPIRLGTTINMIAGSAILAGQLVGFDSDGTAMTVIPCASGTSAGSPIGVALHDQATTGGKVAVAAYGSIILMREGTGTTIAQGAAIKMSTIAGCVLAGDVTNATGADFIKIGTALEDFTANGYSYVLINGPVFLSKGAAP